MSNSNIAIIGCGYLGSEVASTWRNRGAHVTATTRNPIRLEDLSKVAQKGILIKGNDEAEFAPLIAANETLLISIAAESPEHYERTYLQTAQIFRHLAIEMDLPRRLIYTSSTAVYGDHYGRWVDEESDLLATSDQARILTEAEQLYQSLAELGWHVCILRLAEIYGPGREISKRLAQLQGKPLAGTGEQHTNMVHRTDIVGAIDYALRHHLEGFYNLSDDDHPSRKELYDAVAKKFHLTPPTWDPNLTSLHPGNKRVSNHKIKAEGFNFRYPHRILD
ncbi:MAG: SDR family oxidoreductase [Verrucomicrobiota bacterium]|nr:SDR family oxidoreductase [Verrucomicrobiota bacterium]